ncbi:MAG: hypothetical protein DRR08_01765 [Candidatus Parabeggiatoa sp. nov. 2]|nr:MAG: hypothetical protein B6247_00275 [Beggiatoa sp. 4572_84]RKZ64101.1 MAG: hypothetical protein DRR08_01765 [Gammaproteobacteria bacterium]
MAVVQTNVWQESIWQESKLWQDSNRCSRFLTQKLKTFLLEFVVVALATKQWAMTSRLQLEFVVVALATKRW